MMKKETLKLIKEFPGEIRSSSTDISYPLRVYTTEEFLGEIPLIRWHFGFPKDMIEPIRLMLETTLYWANAHWCEDEGFWIYWLTIMTKPEEEKPYAKLEKELDFKLRQYNQCMNWYRRASGAT